MTFPGPIGVGAGPGHRHGVLQQDPFDWTGAPTPQTPGLTVPRMKAWDRCAHATIGAMKALPIAGPRPANPADIVSHSRYSRWPRPQGPDPGPLTGFCLVTGGLPNPTNARPGGASIGAWRMATACPDDTGGCLSAWKHDLLRQHFEVALAEAPPPPRSAPSLPATRRRFMPGG